MRDHHHGIKGLTAQPAVRPFHATPLQAPPPAPPAPPLLAVRVHVLRERAVLRRSGRPFRSRLGQRDRGAVPLCCPVLQLRRLGRRQEHAHQPAVLGERYPLAGLLHESDHAAQVLGEARQFDADHRRRGY